MNFQRTRGGYHFLYKECILSVLSEIGYKNIYKSKVIFPLLVCVFTLVCILYLSSFQLSAEMVINDLSVQKKILLDVLKGAL